MRPVKPHLPKRTVDHALDFWENALRGMPTYYDRPRPDLGPVRKPIRGQYDIYGNVHSPRPLVIAGQLDLDGGVN